MTVSVVIPVYNERDNVSRLYWELNKVLSKLDREYEILFIDDGSTDGTHQNLKKIAAEDAQVRLIRFRRNYGQTAAMQAGIDWARFDAIVTIDGDLQNDPSDIPMMLEKLDQGFDLVHGWRKQRKDAFIHRTLPSKIANWLISRVTSFPIHDLGCTLKVIRREIAQELVLYGEMHRFIPILAHKLGARCVEVETRHRCRTAGETKYGLARTYRVVLDLLTVKYMVDYFAHPMRLFGGIGLWSFAASLLAAAVVVGMKLLGGVDMTGNPLLLFSMISGIAGIQFLTFGLLGEVNARIYFDTANKQQYHVRDMVNFNEETQAPQPILIDTRRRAA